MSTEKISTTCHCKAVKIVLDRKPRALNECHCSICRRYAVQWAYYPKKEVQIIAEPDATDFYIWGDKMIEFHRCKKCGCVTHWAPVDKSEPRMGVNGRLLEKMDKEEIPVKQTRRNDVDFEC